MDKDVPASPFQMSLRLCHEVARLSVQNVETQCMPGLHETS